jgi:protein-S-isoprenylcysteine O-methyltransferase
MSFVPAPHWLGLFYFVSEAGLSIFKRAKTATTTSADQGSIRLLWTVIIVSVAAGELSKRLVPGARVQMLVDLRPVWFLVCLAGIAIRWWAIFHLGRFFTVNVAVARDHRVIDDGPYTLIRHPSYAGALLSFVGLGLSTANWLQCLVMVVPITAAFLRRMTIEEDALLAALGEPYRVYVGRTKRLIPFLY